MTDDSVHLPFFVYGTLLPGQPNYGLWREAIAEFQPAIMTGARLYDLGYFPMLVDAPSGEVRGLLVRVRPSSYHAALSVLDQLEGVDTPPIEAPGYRRVRRIVKPCDGAVAVAWVYVGNEASVIGLEPIDGDWKLYTRGLALPP